VQHQGVHYLAATCVFGDGGGPGRKSPLACNVLCGRFALLFEKRHRCCCRAACRLKACVSLWGAETCWCEPYSSTGLCWLRTAPTLQLARQTCWGYPCRWYPRISQRLTDWCRLSRKPCSSTTDRRCCFRLLNCVTDQVLCALAGMNLRLRVRTCQSTTCLTTAQYYQTFQQVCLSGREIHSRQGSVMFSVQKVKRGATARTHTQHRQAACTHSRHHTPQHRCCGHASCTLTGSSQKGECTNRPAWIEERLCTK
jgi:hypothetical protein